MLRKKVSTRGNIMGTAEELEAQLEEHLANGNDWEEMGTPIPGVFVVKAPATKKKPPLLYLEINPLDDHGKKLKRKGLFLGNKKQFSLYQKVFQNPRVELIVESIEEVNPDRGQIKRKQLKM